MEIGMDVCSELVEYELRSRQSMRGIWFVILFVFFFKQKTAYEIASCLVGSEMCIRDRTTGVSNKQGEVRFKREIFISHP